MSRYLAILRKTRREDELFGRPAATPANGRERWRPLMQEIFHRRGVPAPQAVGFASATPGEGASFVAAHVALEVARSTGRPTLLLEANLHRPAQATQHGVDPDPGLRQLASNPEVTLESCLQPSPTGSLWILPAGSNGVNGSKALPDWSRLERAFAAMRERFPAILVDLPPVNLSGEAILVGTLLDAVVLVVEAGLCSREVVEHAATRLRRADLNVIGAVLNKRKLPIPEPLYRRL